MTFFNKVITDIINETERKEEFLTDNQIYIIKYFLEFHLSNLNLISQEDTETLYNNDLKGGKS